MPSIIAFWRIKMAFRDIRHAIAAHCDAIPSAQKLSKSKSKKKEPRVRHCALGIASQWAAMACRISRVNRLVYLSGESKIYQELACMPSIIAFWRIKMALYSITVGRDGVPNIAKGHFNSPKSNYTRHTS
jgi:hypothetical protein